MYLHLLIKVSKQFFTSALVLYNLLCGCWPFYPWVPACAKSCPLLRAVCMLEQLPLYQELAQTQRHHLTQTGTRGQKCQLRCRSFISLSPVGDGVLSRTGSPQCVRLRTSGCGLPAASKRVLCPGLGALGACAAAHPSDSRFQPVPRATAAAGLHATHAPYNRWRA